MVGGGGFVFCCGDARADYLVFDFSACKDLERETNGENRCKRTRRYYDADKQIRQDGEGFFGRGDIAGGDPLHPQSWSCLNNSRQIINTIV